MTWCQKVFNVTEIEQRDALVTYSCRSAVAILMQGPRCNSLWPHHHGKVTKLLEHNRIIHKTFNTEVST